MRRNFSALVAPLTVLATPHVAMADPFMSMMDSANYSGVQFAGTLMINSHLNGPGGATQAQIDAQNRDIKLSRECRRVVIESTPSGTPARTAGLDRCKAKYPPLMPRDYPVNGGPGIAAKPSGKSAASAPTGVAPSSRYTPSKAITTEVQNAFYTKLKAVNSATAEEVRTKLFAQDIEKLFQKTVQPFGLKSGDLADSATAYYVSMWVIANQAPNPTPRQVAGARLQMQNMLAQSGRLAGTNADKQRASQLLMYETILGLVAFNTDSIDKRKLAKATANKMQRGGMDLLALTLTDQGFVSK